MKLIISPAAAADLVRLHEFLAGRSSTAAERASAALIKAIESLDVFPERGRPTGRPNVRELIVPFGQSNYVLRYAYREQRDEIIVLRVWHGREERE